MAEHDKVATIRPIPSDSEYLYVVVRKGGASDVVVHLTDAYEYGELEYLARPKELRHGGFIIFGLPHAHPPAKALIERAREDGIGIGFLRKFMGALNVPRVADYRSPEERKDRKPT